jgi:hypothetical protein
MQVIEHIERRLLLSSWFVATNGADNNAGTSRRPFATIQEAANHAQPRDTVFIRRARQMEVRRRISARMSWVSGPFESARFIRRRSAVCNGGFGEGGPFDKRRQN